MPYSNEIYQKAERILEKRRDKAEMAAQMRTEEIRMKLPEVDAIQRELSKIGIEISRLFFYQGDVEEKLSHLREESKKLTEQRAKILTENGYSVNAMKPEYICPVCEDK